MTDARTRFSGTKLLLFLGSELVILERDPKPWIDWPARLDFPGGMREGDETPEACILRETREEVGLVLQPGDLTWPTLSHHKDPPDWFFAAHLPVARVADIRLGDEGRGWRMMTPKAYLGAPLAIPPFAAMLARYLAERAGERGQPGMD